MIITTELLAELLALRKTSPMPVIESAHVFDDAEVLKFDPDRTDTYDIAHGLMGILVKIAYVNFLHSKAKHDKMYDDPEDSKFVFTTEELADEVDTVIDQLKEKLGDMSSKDILEAIQNVSPSFKTPLDK